MLSPEYVIFCERQNLTPEEKLAEAVVKDWLRILLGILRKKYKKGWLSPEERKIWKTEIRWPYSENAEFWMEEVLNGSVKSLQTLAEDMQRLMKGEKARFFQALNEIVCCRNKKRKIQIAAGC